MRIGREINRSVALLPDVIQGLLKTSALCDVYWRRELRAWQLRPRDPPCGTLIQSVCSLDCPQQPPTQDQKQSSFTTLHNSGTLLLEQSDILAAFFGLEKQKGQLNIASELHLLLNTGFKLFLWIIEMETLIASVLMVSLSVS